MKQLKFNESKILKALLDKTKTTTIRKAWQIIEEETIKLTDKQKKLIKCSPEAYQQYKQALQQLGEEYQRRTYIVEKPCKYKVGEMRGVVWNKEGEVFCYYCGEELFKKCKCLYKENKLKNIEQIRPRKSFPKNLGKVKITKIEKIKIGKEDIILNKNTHEDYYILTENLSRPQLWDGCYNNYLFLKKLAKSEGFKNPEEMFKFLEEYAGDLNEPKSFWLIEFEWVKDETAEVLKMGEM